MGKGAVKQLGRIRKAAGSVRDLDVQMDLAAEVADALRFRKRGAARDVITGEYVRLESYLKGRRERRAAKLEVELARCEVKVARALERIAGEFASLRSRSPSLLMTARRWKRLSAARMGELSEENLHEYRKQTKASRYVAEQQKELEAALRFAADLREVQDVIGEWHDWALLAEVAEKVLGGEAALTEALVLRRSRSLRAALRVRGR